MTRPAIRPAESLVEAETQTDRILRLMRRHRQRADARDSGNLLGLAAIRQMVGSDRDSVEGDLISLVARGDVEVLECLNGRFWRWYVEPAPRVPVPQEVVDGSFLLQRQVIEGGRSFWFDAETFTNSERAAWALSFAKSSAEYSARERSDRRVQRIRLVSMVSE